jgi:hypothetical protein
MGRKNPEKSLTHELKDEFRKRVEKKGTLQASKGVTTQVASPSVVGSTW